MAPPESPSSEHRSFHPPAEAEWHRMIAVAAYYLAERRGFMDGHQIDDWLAAEAAIRDALHD
jgi:Protein of unknown function (DUF2934)